MHTTKVVLQCYYVTHLPKQTEDMISMHFVVHQMLGHHHRPNQSTLLSWD